MSDVKRYEAVHIRYEDSNIRYGEGCEVEVVAAYDYDALRAVSVDLLEALEACMDYGSMTGHDWVIEKALAAIDKGLGDV